jgi:hypothetical protein
MALLLLRGRKLKREIEESFFVPLNVTLQESNELLCSCDQSRLPVETYLSLFNRNCECDVTPSIWFLWIVAVGAYIIMKVLCQGACCMSASGPGQSDRCIRSERLLPAHFTSSSWAQHSTLWAHPKHSPRAFPVSEIAQNQLLEQARNG